jgi:hypothetical protein
VSQVGSIGSVLGKIKRVSAFGVSHRSSE